MSVPSNRSAGPVALCVITAVLYSASSSAQIVHDPTRPPSGVESASGVAAEGGAALQSVLISPTLKAAIINGQMVKVGEMVGSARLVRVTESEAVLREGNEVQVLRMYPSVEKKDVKPVVKGPAQRARPKAP